MPTSRVGRRLRTGASAHPTLRSNRSQLFQPITGQQPGCQWWKWTALCALSFSLVIVVAHVATDGHSMGLANVPVRLRNVAQLSRSSLSELLPDATSAAGLTKAADVLRQNNNRIAAGMAATAAATIGMATTTASASPAVAKTGRCSSTTKIPCAIATVREDCPGPAETCVPESRMERYRKLTR